MVTFIMTSCDPDLGVANTWELYNNTDQVLIYRYVNIYIRENVLTCIQRTYIR